MRWCFLLCERDDRGLFFMVWDNSILWCNGHIPPLSSLHLHTL